MALESGTRIEDLNTANPADGDDVSEGDDHLRLIKACLQGSFPSLGSTAVQATAEQINELASKASNFVESFNGRQGVVVPAANDYELDDLSDVDTTTTAPANGDTLQYDGSNFVPVTSVQGVACAQITSGAYSGTGDVQIGIDSSIYASSTLTVDTVNNRITNGSGSAVTVMVTAAFAMTGLDGDAIEVIIQRNGSNIGETLDLNPNGDRDEMIVMNTVLSLADTEYVELYVNDVPGSLNANMNEGGTLTVQIIPGA